MNLYTKLRVGQEYVLSLTVTIPAKPEQRRVTGYSSSEKAGKTNADSSSECRGGGRRGEGRGGEGGKYVLYRFPQYLNERINFLFI